MPCLCTTVSMISIYTFRGVVQLFNAVKQQQGKIKQKVSEVKKSVRKTDKVSCIMFTVNMYLTNCSNDDLPLPAIKVTTCAYIDDYSTTSLVIM